MYKSPIDKIYGELQTQIIQEEENMVMRAIRNVGVTVDKEALIKALQYDRNQYAEGYSDGKSDVLDKIRAEIIENSIEDYEYHGCGTDELIIETSQVLKIIDKYKAESEVQE